MIEVGILKNFDSGTYKAGIQLAGSLTTYFDGVSVARNIPSSAMAIGNYVILAIPGGNPKDACVIATWHQGSPGGGAGSFLDLSDTPSSYSGKAGKVPKVNITETALEFAARGWELLAEHVFGSPAISHTINSLDGNSDVVYLLNCLWVYNDTGGTTISLYPNGDTNTDNYRRQMLQAYGANVAGQWSDSIAGFYVGYLSVGSTISWVPGMFLYAKSGTRRAIQGFRHTDYITSLSAGVWHSFLGVWTNTADNITSLLFQANQSNGIGAGSRIQLFREAR